MPFQPILMFLFKVFEFMKIKNLRKIIHHFLIFCFRFSFKRLIAETVEIVESSPTKEF